MDISSHLSPPKGNSQSNAVKNILSIVFVSIIAAILFYFYMGIILGAWQMFSLSGVLFFAAILTALAYRANKHGKETSSIWIMVINIFVAIPLFSVLLDGIGSIFLVLAIGLGFAITTSALSSRGSLFAVLVCGAAGLLSWHIDVNLNPASQYYSTDIELFAPSISLFVVVLGLISSKPFISWLNRRNIKSRLIISFEILGAASMIVAAISLHSSSVLASKFNEFHQEEHDYLTANSIKIILTRLDHTVHQSLYTYSTNYPFSPINQDIITSTRDLLQLLDSYIEDLNQHYNPETANHFPTTPAYYNQKSINQLSENNTRYDATFTILVENYKQRGAQGSGVIGSLFLALDELRNEPGVLNNLEFQASINFLISQLNAITYKDPSSEVNLQPFDDALDALGNTIATMNLPQSEKTFLETVIFRIRSLIDDLYVIENEIANNFRELDEQTQSSILIINGLSADFLIFEKYYLENITYTEKTSKITIAVAVSSALSIAVVLGMHIVNSIATPLVSLSRISTHLGQGNFNARAKVTTNDEIGVLAKSFNQMADQINNTFDILEAKVTERTATLRQRALQLQAAADVGRSAAAVHNLDELLPEVTQLISKYFGYYHVGIFLIDDDSRWAILRAANSPGGYKMLERGHRLKIGEQGIVGFAIGSGKPHIALDVGEDAVYFDNPDMPNTHSELALPLVAGGKMLGALDVQSEEPSAFSQEEIDSLLVLADQVALAINNASLFDQMQSLLQELENRVIERTSELKERNLELEQAYQVLESNQTKLLSSEKMASLGRLTAGIAHEMNSPLGAIRASLAELSELAKEYQSSLDDPNITPEDHAEIIQEMQAAILLANKAANRAAEFVRSIKSQTRDLENPVREIFNPIATVNETLLLLAHELRNSNNTISFDHPDTEISLNGSPGRFAQTISNLVMNAIEANRENGGGMINLQIEVINNVMYLQVSDSGPGISMENITKIFDPMFTTKSLSEGIGLGLTLVHDIVVGEFGGTVEVESAPGEGANFLLNFPLA